MFKKIVFIILSLIFFISCLSNNRAGKINIKEIILSSSKMIIKADGEDKAILSAKVYNPDGKEITDVELEYFVNDIKIDNTEYFTTIAGDYTVYCKYDDYKSNEIVIKANPLLVSLSADKSKITADSIDTVILSVKVDGVIKTAEIYMNGSLMSGTSFKTTTVGIYKFKAKYKNYESSEITVEAVEIPKVAKVLLREKTGKNLLVADLEDKLEFDVTLYDKSENVLTGRNYEIYVNSSKISGNIFQVEAEGEYEIKALSEGIESEKLKIRAFKISKIDLTSDKSAIFNDNTDEVAFTVKIYDLKSEKVEYTYFKIYKNDIEHGNLKFKTDKEGSYKFHAKAGSYKSNSLEIKVIKKSENSYTKTEFKYGHIDKISSVNFFDNDSKFITAGWDKEIKIWSFPEGNLLGNFEIHSEGIEDIVINDTGDTAYTAGKDKMIRIFDLINMEEKGVLGEHEERVNTLFIDENILVSGDFNGIMKIWDISNKTLLKSIEAHKMSIESIYVSNMDIITGSRDNTIKIWNKNDYILKSTLEGHGYWVNYIDFSTDRKFMVTADWDNSVELWYMENQSFQKSYFGHQLEEALSSIRKFLVSLSTKTIKIDDAIDMINNYKQSIGE